MRDERGQSVSALVALVVVALLLVAGLVVDGGAQAAAARRAEVAAAAAAREGADAGAASRLVGRTDVGAVRREAAAALARHGVSGTVEVTAAGTVVVRTRVEAATMFLQLVGVSHLGADGSAEARLTRR